MLVRAILAMCCSVERRIVGLESATRAAQTGLGAAPFTRPPRVAIWLEALVALSNLEHLFQIASRCLDPPWPSWSDCAVSWAAWLWTAGGREVV